MPEARVRYTRELLDGTPTVQGRFVGPQPARFSVDGLEVARDRVEIGGRLTGNITPRLSVGIDALGDVSPERSGYAISGVLNFAW